VDYTKEHKEHLAEDYLQKSKMWKDGVWATDIEISAAANFLQTDIYTYTEIPGENTTLAWIKFPASCSCDDGQPDYSAIYLDHSTGNHYDCVQSLTSI